MLRLKNLLNEEMAKNTGKTLKQMEKSTDRDNFMSAEEAKNFGLIDNII